MTIGYNGRVGYASPNFFGGKSKDALVDGGCGAGEQRGSVAHRVGVQGVRALLVSAPRARRTVVLAKAPVNKAET